MSKKKAFSGSPMTLRDFHGGSIPSDLPLPSAPGMIVERKNHDRPSSGGWMGSSLNRGYGGERGGFLRQGSGNFTRSFEEKASYLPNPANIGRNYDEDERKPVDGHNRGGQGAESFEERQVGHERLPERYSLDNRSSYTPLKYVDSRADGYAHEDFGLVPVGPPKSQSQDFQRRSQASSRYTQDALPVHSVGSQDHSGFYQSPMTSGPQHSSQQLQESVVSPWRQNSLVQQPVTPGTVLGSGSGVQNVWTARREGELNRTYSAEFGVNDSVGDGRSQVAGSRIAQASALEKVSSGRWNPRIIHLLDDPPQVHIGEYGQPHGGPYEGASTNSPLNNMRYAADLDQVAYNDTLRNEHSRAVYMESGGGIDTVPSRDARFDMVQGSLPDSRREQFVEGRGMSLPEFGKYRDDRRGYGEIGWKGNAGQRDSAEGGAYVEPGYTRGPKDPARFDGNEAVPYVEAVNNLQSNSGWIQPEPSPRRDYGDGRIMDANRGITSDSERRGVAAGVDNDLGLSSYGSRGFEGQRGTHPDGLYHAYGKEEVGQQASPYLKGRDHFPHDVSDLSKGGRLNDRNRGPLSPDFDHSTGRLRSPGGVRTSAAQETGGSADVLSLEFESKSVAAERPKLKLLQRTKPLEVNSMEEFEGLQEDSESGQIIRASSPRVATGAVSMTAAATVSAGSKSSSNEEPTRPVERPKLSLKPRSQPADVVPDSGSEKERMSLFGGARPRELVLKERGVDESMIVGVDLAATPGPLMSGLRTPNEGNRISGGGLEYGVEKQDKLEEKKLDGRRAEQREIGNARQLGRHGSEWLEWNESRTEQREIGNVRQLGRHDSGRLERNESRGRKERIDLDKKEDRQGSDHRHLQERGESDRLDVNKQDSWRRSPEISNSSFGPQSPMPEGAGELSSGGPGRVAISSAADLAQAFSRSASFGSGHVGTKQGNFIQRSPMPRSPGPGFGLGLDSPGHYKASPKDVPFSRLTEALSHGPRDAYTSGVQDGYRRTSAF